MMFYLKGLLLVFISLTIINCANLFKSLENLKPAFWLAKKGESKVYILGTVHYGVSLEDLKCSKEIKKYLKESSLLFSEMHQSPLDPKNLKNMKKYVLGSVKTKETLLKRLSQNEIKTLKKQIDGRINIILLTIYGTKNVSFNKEDAFEELNQSSQQFLKEHGFYNPNKNYFDYMKDLFTKLYYPMFFEFPLLDVEILKLAAGYKKTIQTLDTASLYKDAIEDLDNTNMKIMKITNPHNDKQQIAVTANLIDNLIKNQSVLREKINRAFFNKKQFKAMYKNWKNHKKTIMFDSVSKTRNEHWLNKILDLFTKNANHTVFAAGGLAHFVSSHNVLDMLIKEGFEVQLINPRTCGF